MIEAIVALAICIAGVGFFFLGRKAFTGRVIKLHKFEIVDYDIFYKAMAVVQFVLITAYAFGFEVISDQIGLDGNGNPDFAQLQQWQIAQMPYLQYYPIFTSGAATVLITILRWLTMMMFAVMVLLPFFKKKEAEDFAALLSPLLLLLNVIFLKPICKTMLGYVDFNEWMPIVYICMLVIAGGLSIDRTIRFFVDKDFGDILKRLGKLGIFVLFYLMAFMPEYAPQLFFGYRGETPASFALCHRLLIYLAAIFPFSVYFIMRNRPLEERRYLLIMLALSGFIQFFDRNLNWAGSGWITSLPLHLCHTAIALMFFAFTFNLKGVFYFTYLVNVLGALFALVMPNTSGYFTEMGNMVFFYNHIYAVCLPVLAVALKVFERPNMKLMKKAIIAFSIYVIAAATLDGWLNNSASLNPGNYGDIGHADIDYFFLYSDFFVNKFTWAIPIKYNFILRFKIGDTMMTYYYMYQLVIWAIFVACMFVMWGLYGILYKAGDAHQELLRRKILMRVDKVNLLKELDGRSPKEPLHPEGANMIKISHFTKRYAGSDRKAVDDLSLEIHEGEVFGFIGHNGAGKSTTIKSLVGIQTISEGSIEIQGYDIARQPLEAKLNIGYVSDNHAVYEKLTGREYVGYVADLYMVEPEIKNKRIAEYAKMFHLEDAIDREIKSYSHGMKQKLMVISTLIHDPKVWVLDEPLTGLDPTSSWQIKECMRTHADKGNIVFFSSHVIEVVEKICDRVAIISGGKLCRVCTPAELQEEGKSLEELYLKYASLGADADKADEAAVAIDEAAAAIDEAVEAESSEKNVISAETPIEEQNNGEE